MKQIRLMNIVPVVYTDDIKASVDDRKLSSKQLLEKTNGTVLLETRIVEGGCSSIECSYDSAVSLPYVLKLAQQAEDEGFDAVILDCFMDPGLSECRELLRIPVFGPCQSGCFLAMRLGGSFSVICVLKETERGIKENLAKYGISNFLASMPMLGIPVTQLHVDEKFLIDRIVDIGYKAAKEDNAKVLVFGCTGMSTTIEPVTAALRQKGIELPIIEPFLAAVHDAVSCVMMGVSHSKSAYMQVREKMRKVDW